MRNIHSLKLNKEFKRAYYRGKYKAHPLLITYLFPMRGSHIRVGITTGKKVGNAVLRNRARRIIRAAFLELQPSLPAIGADLVFVARAGTSLSNSNQIKEVMQKQIKQLLQQKNTPKKPMKKPTKEQ